MIVEKANIINCLQKIERALMVAGGHAACSHHFDEDLVLD
jgi:hypothetical protein